MPWECLKCGRKNGDENQQCEKCMLDRETALTMVVNKKKRMCEDCGHMHREGVYCHAYTEAAEDFDGEEVFSESEEGSEEDSDDDKLGIRRTVLVKEKKVKMKPLETPAFVKAIRYIRCNCKEGVPAENRRFEPVPKVVMVGKIQVQLYHEIMDPDERHRFLMMYNQRNTETKQSKREQKKNEDLSMIIPTILSYLPYGLCSPVPKVCRYWNIGTNMYKEYVDMRNCYPWQAYRPHMSQVDAVLVHGNKIYSSGDKRVMVSDMESGEVLSTITRDSGNICFLFEREAELFCCSSNGSIRTYTLTHTGNNIQMAHTMWDHTKTITQLLPALPSVGICEMHGIDSHVCSMYTASEDRSVKLWNLSRYQCIRAIGSASLRTASFTRIALSRRHLFVGTTTASVAIFSLHPICERDDVHQCNIPGKDKTYCLQLTLKLPAIKMKNGGVTSVTGLLCTGYGYGFSHLWASDSSGQMTIWHVPESGLQYTPATTFKGHDGAINQLLNTWRHVISVSDDGVIKLWDIVTFVRIKTINIMEWCNYRSLLPRPDIDRKVKCVHIEEGNEDIAGSLVVGTSYGDVIVLSLGSTM